MKTICGLTPCLMLDNTRDINKKSITSNMEHLKLDNWALYDQNFGEGDFIEGCEHIAHEPGRAGWVKSRNGLLKWFYESDYDYAFWIDANSTISKPTLNDVKTIVEAIREDKLDNCDAIFGTLGMWVSQDRIIAKSAPDFKENVHLIPAKINKSYNWMHGLFIKNFKKYYGQEFYIDERCDTLQGIPEDVYFARLLRRFANCYVAPTVVCNKPTSKHSCTMDNGKGTYEYPLVLFDVVDNYILESADKNKYKQCNPHTVVSEIILPRCDYMLDLIKPYSPRSKKQPSTTNRVSLF